MVIQCDFVYRTVRGNAWRAKLRGSNRRPNPENNTNIKVSTASAPRLVPCLRSACSNAVAYAERPSDGTGLKVYRPWDFLRFTGPRQRDSLSFERQTPKQRKIYD